MLFYRLRTAGTARLPRHYCRTTVHTAPEEALGACMHAHDVRIQRAVRSAQKKP